METTARSYFEERHDVLAVRHDNGCEVRAWTMARLLREQRYSGVHVLKLQGTDRIGESRLSLYPSAWPQTAWGNHWICMAGDTVYDPILSDPLPRETYLAVMFPDQIVVPTIDYCADDLTDVQLREECLRAES